MPGMNTTLTPNAPAASRTTVTAGTALTFEMLTPGASGARCHDHDALLRVVRGTVRVSTPTQEQAIVPAGVPHSLGCEEDEARILMGFRPPAR
jgi:quercetin dioxygenase-like cupin family protein